METNQNDGSSGCQPDCNGRVLHSVGHVGNLIEFRMAPYDVNYRRAKRNVHCITVNAFSKQRKNEIIQT